MLRLLKLLVVLGLMLAVPFAPASARPDPKSPPARPSACSHRPVARQKSYGIRRQVCRYSFPPIYLHPIVLSLTGCAGAIVLRCLQRSVSDAEF
jgi:hypothetical protein